MEIDRQLLASMRPSDSPLLHFYDWRAPSATYGYFVDPAQFLNVKKAQEWGLELARRPTGGGILFHTSDLAFSVLVPADHPGYSEDTLTNYRFVNERVLSAIEKVGALGELLSTDPLSETAVQGRFCMAKPTIYDVMIGEKKSAGAAQRKKQNGFLHQGSIAIALPQREMLEDLLALDVVEAMEQITFVLGGELKARRAELKNALREAFV